MMRTLVTFAIGSAAIGVVGLSTVMRADPILLWNASASVPIGFYAMRDLDRPMRGDLAVIDAPEPLSGWLQKRGYLDADLPLIKYVAAIPGQRVCRNGVDISIDGVTVATAKERDRFDRRLPIWQGCQMLADGQIFLLNPDAEASLDSRYFGPLPRDTIIGRAVPIWTRED